MKWFQHLTDSHNNPKTRNLIRQFGCEGYGILFICREIVGKYGDKFRLKSEKNWKNLLKEATLIDDKKIDEVLNFLATNKDICHKALEIGDLYIPKMKEYSDNWTKKLQRNYEVTTSQVPLHNITLQDITKHYITIKGWGEKSLSKEDYARYGKAIKNLYIRSNQDANLVKRAISWISKQGYDWTLETVLKKFPDFLKVADKEKEISEMEALIGK